MMSGRPQDTPTRSYEVVEYAKGTVAGKFFQQNHATMHAEDF